MNKNDKIACLYSKGYTKSELKKMKKFPECEKGFFDFCDKNNIHYICWNDIFLKKTKPLPYILYYLWNIKLLNKKIIWIVWPRKINNFISHCLEIFFENIKWKDVVTISWMAPWTDQYAHNLSLKYKIPTIAVLWVWLKTALNSNYRNKINKIIDNQWLVLSEFRLEQDWEKWTFPQRNRIIAWLSNFLFVPQASKKSWTLITVNKAIEYNIPTYSCFSQYDDEFWKWTNELITQNKITWIHDFNKFLSEISEKFSLNILNSWININLNKKEENVLNHIISWNNSLEKLTISTWLEIAELINIISSLELNWIIYEQNWEYFSN